MRGIILVCLIVLFSCKNSIEDKIGEQNEILHKNFNENFSRPYKVQDSLSAVECFIKVEEYFKFLGILESSEKSSYISFYENFILKNTNVELACLYNNFPSTEMLLIPSNLNYVFENFKAVNERYDNESLKSLVESLNGFKEDYEIKFLNRSNFMLYLNSISDEKFEKHITYRIPLIVMSLLELDSR